MVTSGTAEVVPLGGISKIARLDLSYASCRWLGETTAPNTLREHLSFRHVQADVLAGISCLVVVRQRSGRMARRRGDGSRYGLGGPLPQARGSGQGLTPRTRNGPKARAAKGVE